MNKNIKVSVIVPVYNVYQFLRKCLDSVVNQTLKEIEIICVNDGSTDRSADIIKEYEKKYDNIIVINQENKGLATARNVAMHEARGEYIGFVDSDDWVDNNYFESLYNVAKKYDSEIACCGFVRAYSESKFKKRLQFYGEMVHTSSNQKFATARMPKFCQVFNKIYKRDFLERNELRFPDGKFFEDVAFSVRAMFLTNMLAITPNTRYYYRVNKNSIMRGEMIDQKQIDLMNARKYFIEFARDHHIKCDDRYFVQKKIFFKLFNVLIMKVCVWETIKKYYLFGLIKVFERRDAL